MQSANYFGSITQSSTVLVGSNSTTGEETFVPMRSMLPMVMSCMYRDRLKNMQILLSRTQARPGRAVKQEKEQTSRNHLQAF